MSLRVIRGFPIGVPGTTILRTSGIRSSMHPKPARVVALTARAELLGTGGNAHRKLGWQVRTSLAADAPHVTAVVPGVGVAGLLWRGAAAPPTDAPPAGDGAPPATDPSGT